MKKLILITGFIAGLSSLSYGQSEPPYGMSQLEAYSVFYENFRTGDYETALTFGRWMLEAKPREIQGHRSFTLDTQFDRFIRVYQGLAEDASDPTAKTEYLEKALEIFDLTFETFSEDEIDIFRWTYRKGRFYQDHYRNLPDGLDKAYENYEKTFEMDPQRFTEMNDGYFARILLQNYVSQGEKEKALQMIEEIEQYASATLEQVINEARNDLFDEPEERIEFLESRLAEADNEEELLSELATLYEEVGNREKAIETARRLYDLNPNFENTRTLADISLSNAQYKQALNYLIEAFEKGPSDNVKKEIALEISSTYQNINDLRSAREYARKASQIDPDWGQPYLRISSIYAAAIQQCTSDRKIERQDRTVYWLVLDYLDRARQRDSSVSSTVNRRYDSYTPVMPQAEDKFFEGWEVGEDFRIDGSIGECYSWINETTTVR
ncbi:MAG: hypothetical protein WDZ36_04015 [Balneolaceae bacterium]